MQRTIVTAVVSLSLIILLFNTRVGVFIVFDVLGDAFGSDNLPTLAAQGPLRLTRSISADERIVLPDAIQQASGLSISGDHILISTDQAELFVIDAEGELQTKPADLIAGPLLLKQGSLEGIQFQSEELVGIGELGALASWSEDGNSWLRNPDQKLPAAIADYEFTGLTQHRNQLWATTDEGLLLVNLTSGSQRRLDLSAYLKPNRRQSELLLSGLASDGEYLYLLTENYASLIVYETETESIQEIVGIDAIEASDIAIKDNRAWVSVDHNYFDARPPLHVYSLIQ